MMILGSGRASLEVEEIKKYHKNRYPWFFVDEISIVEKGVAEGTKVFSCNEFFSKSGCVTIPNFIVGEALEQTALITFMEKNSGMLTNTVSSDMEYFQEVSCGDILFLRAELKNFCRGIAKVYTMARIDNKVVCKGVFVIAVPDVMNAFLPK